MNIDTQSMKSYHSNASVTSSRNKPRVCGGCGWFEQYNWNRHNKTYHDSNAKEWKEGVPLTDTPWCDNWQDILATPELTPINKPQRYARIGCKTTTSVKSFEDID